MNTIPIGVTQAKKEKNVKLNTRTLSLACLAAFALLFVVSTPAQKVQLPTQTQPAKAVIGDASVTGTTQERHAQSPLNRSLHLPIHLR